MRFVTLPDAGSMRTTSPSASPPTQTLPPALASPYVHSCVSTFSVGVAISAVTTDARRTLTEGV